MKLHFLIEINVKIYNLHFLLESKRKLIQFGFRGKVLKKRFILKEYYDSSDFKIKLKEA